LTSLPDPDMIHVLMSADLTNNELLARLRREQERRGVLPNSIVARERRVKALMRWMEPRPILEASREDIESYLDELQITSSSRAGYLSHFHALFKFAVEEALLTVTPTAGITRPRRRRRLPRPTGDADVVRAIEEAGGDLKCFLLLAAYQGLRCQEIAGLAGEDVDRDAGVLMVRHGKGDRDRIMPLHPAVDEALPVELVAGPLFRLADGRPMRPHNVSHHIRSHLVGLGIASSAHCLRHAFATGVYRLSQDLRLTQELLGHSSPATTAIYAGFDPAGAGMMRSLSFGSKHLGSDPNDAAEPEPDRAA
jgi:integrase/recombinase XerC